MPDACPVLHGLQEAPNERYAIKVMKKSYFSWDECMTLREIQVCWHLHFASTMFDNSTVGGTVDPRCAGCVDGRSWFMRWLQTGVGLRIRLPVCLGGVARDIFPVCSALDWTLKSNYRIPEYHGSCGDSMTPRIHLAKAQHSPAYHLQSLKKLNNHPNIIKLKEVIRENNTLYMVFEFMQANLFELMQQRNKPFPEADVKHVTFQVSLVSSRFVFATFNTHSNASHVGDARLSVHAPSRLLPPRYEAGESTLQWGRPD